MSISTITTLAISAAIGSGVAGGVLFAFSVFLMRALDKLPAAQSISAMQAINKAAVTPLFMLVLFGTAIVSAALAWSSISRSAERAAPYLLIASALYIGAVLLTIIYHVPHNNALAALDPLSADAGHRWQAYTTGWTAWNHVRAVLAIASATLFTIGAQAGC